MEKKKISFDELVKKVGFEWAKRAGEIMSKGHFNPIKIDGCSDKIKILEKELEEEAIRYTDNLAPISFKIVAGSFIMEEKEYKSKDGFMLLEISCSDEEVVKQPSLEKLLLGIMAIDIATDFCRKNNFKINNHFNSYPIFQATIIRMPE
jgi:hypothetical protein